MTTPHACMGLLGKGCGCGCTCGRNPDGLRTTHAESCAIKARQREKSIAESPGTCPPAPVRLAGEMYTSNPYYYAVDSCDDIQAPA